MSQPIENPVISYVTNGVTTTFPYPFSLQERDDLVVTLNNVVITTGFTVSNVGIQGGGDVVFSVAPAASQTLVLARVIEAKREDDYQDTGPWDSKQVNRDFDRIWQFLQLYNAHFEQSIKLPIGSADQTIDAAPEDRAHNLIGFDAAGNVTVLAAADVDLTAVSLFMSSFLEAESAADARFLLGLSSVPSTAIANTWTKAQRGAIVTLTDVATIPINFDDANNFQLTIGGNRALGNPTNQVGGQGGSIFITQDATGSRALTYGSNWKFPGGIAPSLSTAANAVDRLDYVVRSNGFIHATLSKDIK